MKNQLMSLQDVEAVVARGSHKLQTDDEQRKGIAESLWKNPAVREEFSGCREALLGYLEMLTPEFCRESLRIAVAV
jgi:hypothetical protein